MSADNIDDEELPPEPGGPFQEPTGRYFNFVTVRFFFPDGKTITIETFTIYADDCLSDEQIRQELDFYIGPLYSRLAAYPRLAAAAGGTIPWEIVGTACGFGSE